MPAPDKIKELIERFERNIEAYKQGKYNETQTRREFIDPFFTELGWDVDNKDGYAEAYKDVVHEDAIKVGSKMKAPDYSFRIGGVRKFFLEAKKPSVNIKDDVSPAYQLRRYAWSAKLPLSILTDFEELSVYDCRYRPFPKDKASKSRIKYINYRDYIDQWDEIYGIFSKESILKGSFDKFADTSKGKKGTAEVDAEFLKEIEKWRDFLARNIALRNSQLSQRELNYAVQKTIDRIIFLRICEDRGIEQYGRLGALQNGANVYERLLEYFRGADAKYNSGLFHFANEKGREGERDILTPNLKIDDKTFKEIVKNLYYPVCPYEFSVLSADILGQVYEQFLGKVIYLTKGHQAKVEEKPEVRKAGGVYYTPKYIVDYIVENTVGKLTWEYVAKKCNICDACGGEVGKGDRVSGLGAEENDTEFKKKGDGENAILQGTGGLATVNGSGGGNIQADGEFSQDRTIRTDKPDEKGSSFHTCKYCGRIREEAQGRLSQAHLNSIRLSDGIGNTSGNSSKIKVPEQNSNAECRIANASIRKNADKIIPVSRRSSKTLNPKPQTLDPSKFCLKILDPACGSGSFLIGAYQYLLDWHLKQYIKDTAKFAKGRKPKIRQTSTGDWRLTIDERKRILLNNIYGVDIDAAAVEVTKLSLLLKVLEDESGESLENQLTFTFDKERVLPDLCNNIKCGNSLIGPDFYDGKDQQPDLFDEDALLKVNAFDWAAEFTDIMQDGGFDAVIGNPPYLAGREWTDELRTQRTYFKEHFSCMTDQYDLYALFIQQGIELLRENGQIGYITPTTWLNNEHYQNIRVWLIDHCNVALFGDYRNVKVFPTATVLPIVLVGIRSEHPKDNFSSKIEVFTENGFLESFNTSANVWKTFPELTFNLSLSELDLPIIKKIDNLSEVLQELCEVRFGVKVYQKGKGTPPQTGEEAKSKKYESTTKLSKEYLPYVRGRNINRFSIDANLAWLKYGKHLAEPRSIALFTNPRLLVRRIVGNKLIILPIEDSVIADQLLHTVRPLKNCTYNFLYLAGLLGSNLLAYYFRKRYNRNEKTFPEIRVAELRSLPIRTIDFSNSDEKALHDEMVKLVDRMLDLNKKLPEATLPQVKTTIQRQIDTTDKQIDQLVYKLYDLTEEEIKIVEGKNE